MKYEWTRRVDTDGVLRFALDLGEEYANKCVRLTVAPSEPSPENSTCSKEVDEKPCENLVGKWEGAFARIPHGKTMRVDANGVLTLPFGETNANKRVYVTVEMAEPTAEMAAKNREEWLRFIENTAGKITDPTFERHPQGEYEQREEL